MMNLVVPRDAAAHAIQPSFGFESQNTAARQIFRSQKPLNVAMAQTAFSQILLMVFLGSIEGPGRFN